MQTLTVRASLAKFSSEFTIQVDVASSSTGGKKRANNNNKSGGGLKKASLTKSVGAWIDGDGHFSREALLEDLKRLIETKAE